MNCETCEWYRYPMLTDKSLNTKPIPTIITACAGVSVDGATER